MPRGVGGWLRSGRSTRAGVPASAIVRRPLVAHAPILHALILPCQRADSPDRPEVGVCAAIGDNRIMTFTSRAKADSACAAGIETARQGLAHLVPESEVGEHLGFDVEGERVVTHYFAAARPGYRGWRWSV